MVEGLVGLGAGTAETTSLSCMCRDTYTFIHEAVSTLL